jgi:hypothetical protein
VKPHSSSDFSFSAKALDLRKKILVIKQDKYDKLAREKNLSIRIKSVKIVTIPNNSEKVTVNIGESN